MDKDTLLEEIRALLREPLTNVGISQQIYADDELITQIRSALRYIRSVDVVTDAAMAVDGTWTEPATERQGTLVALRVAASLLRGDLIHRVMSGQMGMVFRMGNDLIDTKTAAIEFQRAAGGYTQDFNTLLTIELSQDSYAPDVFGNPSDQGGA